MNKKNNPGEKIINIPRDISETKENGKRYSLKRGTYKRRPTVRISDPTADGIGLKSNWPGV